MTPEDVAWLRTRLPFAGMRDSTFPKSIPLKGILANDCRIRRYQRGEVIVREGDYGNSAFLVLSGSARIALDRLPPQSIGRTAPNRRGWTDALRQIFNRRRFAEVRDRDQVSVHDGTRVQMTDHQPAVFLQDFQAVFTHENSLPLGPGELFGEVAAMYRTPQTATVVAEDETLAVEIRWQGLRLLRRDQVFADQLEQHYRQHWLLLHLRETPLLRFLPDDVLRTVADATQMRSFGQMEWNADFEKTRRMPVQQQIQQEPLIAIEGHLPTDLILIRAGFARVSHHHGEGHKTTAYLGKGHVFGLPELAHNVTRKSSLPARQLQQSLRAVGFVDTLHIPVEIFADCLLPYVRSGDVPGFSGDAADHGVTSGGGGERRQVERSRPGEKIVTTESSDPNAVSTGLLEFLVQQRLTNGRQAMVIDLNRCTRCDDCVKACAATHDGNPRMTRTGRVHDHLMFAEACMHCTDPVCMIGCPTGAITRNQSTGTVYINEPTCIGCGTCANACPYDNISMVEIRRPDGHQYLDASNGLPILKATKCDLCQTQPSGPACVNACPHDAVGRLDLSHLGPLDQWLRRRE
jgi:Fe-S-cluster-containing dehydrogenase component/CRP-like cAMP-binding protein